MDETHDFCPYDGKPYSTTVCSYCNRVRYIKKPQWKKVLYEKQPFADTYVDENFLNSLIAKENYKKYDYSTLIDSTSEITSALNSLILFLEFHELSYLEYISDFTLLLSTFVCLVIGYILYIVLLPPTKRSIKPIRTGILLLGILHTLSPVLATINKNYANDTIYLMTFVFCILHLLCFDYSFVKNFVTSEKKITPDVKSMTFALISALLLSSRLSTLNYVYFLLSFGFMYYLFRIFGFFPYLRGAVYNYSPEMHSKLDLGLCFLNSWIVSKLSFFLSVLVFFTYFFIRFLGPLWLLSVYHYKNEIKGPWDLPEIKRNFK